MKVTIIAGARPNFMKIAPLMRAIKAAKAAGKNITARLVYTGSDEDKSLEQISIDWVLRECDTPKEFLSWILYFCSHVFLILFVNVLNRYGLGCLVNIDAHSDFLHRNDILEFQDCFVFTLTNIGFIVNR